MKDKKLLGEERRSMLLELLKTSRQPLTGSELAARANVSRQVIVSHSPAQTEKELQILVDHGVTIKDVKIEHPVYGDLTASIMVSTRSELAQFMNRIRTTNAGYLSELTEGIHLHTIAAASEKILDEAEAALKAANFLISQ